MTLFYKHLSLAGTALCLFFIAFLPAQAIAADPIFTVENVAVDVTAENAIAAREQAFAEAQTKAFTELSTRMLPENELATFPPPDPVTISTLIQDFEIVSEQLSAIRYVGQYTFRFNDKAVRQHFSGAGTQYSDVSSQSLLILPFLQMQNGTVLWSPFNRWKQGWNRAQNLRGLVPLEVPLGDLEDVRDIPENSALSYNPRNLDAILSRYGAGEAVIAIARPDLALEQIRSEQQTATGRLSVEVYRTDRDRPELVQQINVIANGAQTVAQLYDTAVIRTHQALQKDWKAKTIVSTAASNRMRVTIPIRSLQHWINIQSDLKRTSGIARTEIKSLTPGQAVMDILFQGDSGRLALTLAQAGYSLEQFQNPQGQPVTILRDGRTQQRL